MTSFITKLPDVTLITELAESQSLSMTMLKERRVMDPPETLNKTEEVNAERMMIVEEGEDEYDVTTIFLDVVEREVVSDVSDALTRKTQSFEEEEEEAASERELQVDVVGEMHDELDPLDIART